MRAKTPLLRVALLLCGLLGHASSVWAADSERVFDLLRVQAGATCLDAARLAKEAAAFLDMQALPSDVVIAVKGSAIDPYSVRLHVLRDERSVAYRTFDPGPNSCDRLHAAVGLALALALKASRADVEQPQPASATAVSPVATPPPWSLSATGLVAYRLLPELGPGAALLARRAFGAHLVARLGVLGTLASDVALARGAGAFDAALLLARADACARSRLLGRVSGGLCLSLLSGALHAAGAQLAEPKRATVAVFALANAVELELALSARWSLALDLSTTLLLHRVVVGVQDVNGVKAHSRRLSSLGFVLGLGPVYYFW